MADADDEFDAVAAAKELDDMLAGSAPEGDIAQLEAEIIACRPRGLEHALSQMVGLAPIDDFDRTERRAGARDVVVLSVRRNQRHSSSTRCWPGQGVPVWVSHSSFRLLRKRPHV